MVSPCTTTEKPTTPKGCDQGFSLPNSLFPPCVTTVTMVRVKYKETGMAGFFTSFRFKAILALIVACVLTALYSYFIADTIMTRITDAQYDEGGRKDS